MTPISKVFSACLLLFVLFYSVFSFAQNGNGIKSGVVKVLVSTHEGTKKVGTGFIVQLDSAAVYIATASHVVEGAQKIQVEFFTNRNRPVSAEIIGMEGGDPQGLAVLLVDGKIPSGLSVLEFNPSPVAGGDTVRTIGFPRSAGVPWASTKGGIVGRKGKAITFSGAVDEGNSGGPLIKDNQVVGIVTDVTGKFANAVPAVIAQFTLKSWGVTPEESPAGRQGTTKVFAPPSKIDSPQTKRTEPLPPAESILNISNVWRDSNYPSNVSQFTQDGNSFYFKRRGVLPNGTRFESVGSGTITGLRFTSNYNATYQSGATSVGDCSGTVSPDGMRMEMNCRDSLLGAFPVTAIRQ